MQYPMPIVGAKDMNDVGAAEYNGINDGANRPTGNRLDTKPATIGTFSALGLNTQPARSEEMPKTAPLCKRRLEEAR